MVRRLIVLAVLTAVVTAVPVSKKSTKKRYDGHQLVQVQLTTQEQLDFFKTLQNSKELKLDMWTEVTTRKPVDVHVAPAVADTFQKTLEVAGIKHNVSVPDIQKLIDSEVQQQALLRYGLSLSSNTKTTRTKRQVDLYSLLFGLGGISGLGGSSLGLTGLGGLGGGLGGSSLGLTGLGGLTSLGSGLGTGFGTDLSSIYGFDLGSLGLTQTQSIGPGAATRPGSSSQYPQGQSTDVSDAVRALASSVRTNVGGEHGLYRRHGEINDWIERKAVEYSTIANTESIGATLEGRDMKLIIISDNREKQAVWVDCGIHAREWITPATCLYMIDMILQGYSNDPIINRFTWFVLPAANPDGYEYSHDHDRLWRKTRSGPHGNGCWGVDPNRNFDFHWGEPGASDDPCSEVYHGPQAFSERNTQNMAHYLSAHSGEIKMYISIHSYSQLWLTPWGHTNVPPPDNDELLRVANIGAQAIQSVNGRYFQVGPPTSTLYGVSGDSADWAKGIANIEYSYILECRPDAQNGGTGGAGFILDASEIVPSGQEIWAGIKSAADALPNYLP